MGGQIKQGVTVYAEAPFLFVHPSFLSLRPDGFKKTTPPGKSAMEKTLSLTSIRLSLHDYMRIT
jgi:hypothetical protein